MSNCNIVGNLMHWLNCDCVNQFMPNSGMFDQFQVAITVLLAILIVINIQISWNMLASSRIMF